MVVLEADGEGSGRPPRVLQIRAHTDPPAGASQAVPGIGHVTVTGYLDDPALPGVAEAVAGLRAPVVVRYRPGMRCTVRGWSGGNEVFVKVAPAAVTAGDDAEVLWSAYRAGVLPFAVAEPLEWIPRSGTLVQGLVPGAPILPQVLGPAGPELAHRLGSALAALAVSPVVASVQAPAAVQLARTDRAVARAAARVPALTGRLQRVAAELRADHGRFAARPLVPCHGAPHVHQWLADGSRLGLIDFDRFALGEPEFDVAAFLAELETERGMVHPLDRIASSLTAGFAEGGHPLDPERIRVYRQQARLAKVARTAMALRPDAAERAEVLLARIERRLGDAMPA